MLINTYSPLKVKQQIKRISPTVFPKKRIANADVNTLS